MKEGTLRLQENKGIEGNHTVDKNGENCFLRKYAERERDREREKRVVSLTLPKAERVREREREW